MKDEIHIDFETRSTADLRKTGAHAYAEHPDTDAWCMAYAINDGPPGILTRPDILDNSKAIARKIVENSTIIAHNAQFELQIWNKVMVRKYDWPPLAPEQCRCTMAMCHALSLPASLENAAAAVGLDVRKDMKGRNLMLRMARPRKIEPDGTITWWHEPARLQALYDYCIQDVVVERELDRMLIPLSDAEQALWVLDQKINERGVHVDLQAIDTAVQVVEATKKRLDARMRQVTGGWVKGTTSVAQLVEWLSMHGIDTSGLAKGDVTDLLDRDDLPPDARTALELRRAGAKSSTAKLTSMRNGASDDGRCRGVTQYHGAGTGRWAGRRIQTQNYPRPEHPQWVIEDVMEMLSGV